MWSSCRRVLQDLLILSTVRSFSLTPAQNTVVVERWWQVPLSKVGRPPRLYPRRHRIYKLVEDTKHLPQEKMELILTQSVPKFGGRGDAVFVKKSVGRNKLLPQGLAVYPSPENKQMFTEELRLLREGRTEDRVQTHTGQLTAEYLKRSHLKIIQMPSDEFQVNKAVVCRQFQKKLGVVVPPHTISLQFDSVKEVGDYWCEITINGLDKVRVPISVVPYEDQSASYKKQLRVQKKQQQEAEKVLEPAGVEDTTVDAAVEAEAVKDSVREVSEDSTSTEASAAEETAGSTPTSQDTTTQSDSQK